MLKAFRLANIDLLWFELNFSFANCFLLKGREHLISLLFLTFFLLIVFILPRYQPQNNMTDLKDISCKKPDLD